MNTQHLKEKLRQNAAFVGYRKGWKTETVESFEEGDNPILKGKGDYVILNEEGKLEIVSDAGARLTDDDRFGTDWETRLQSPSS